MSNRYVGTWTDERREIVAKLWEQGKSNGQIACVLGNGISRNAVIGIVTRMGLATKSGVQRQPAHQPRALGEPRAKPGPKPRIASTARDVPNEIADIIATDNDPDAVLIAHAGRPALRPEVRITFVRQGQCKWPIGDPREDGFEFCGSPATGNYCEDHKAIAFAPPKPRAPRNGTELARSLRRYL